VTLPNTGPGGVSSLDAGLPGGCCRATQALKRAKFTSTGAEQGSWFDLGGGVAALAKRLMIESGETVPYATLGTDDDRQRRVTRAAPG
jgi:hypothetical protein